MSTETPPAPATPPEVPPSPADTVPGVWQRAMSGSAGAITSVITTIIAFLVGGLAVLAIGSNPVGVYKGIFDGTGLNWFNPFLDADMRESAAYNLQQTLLLTTTLILTGLAVAFAFRCGLFNIGGQGQWAMGAIVSVWVGSSFADMAGGLHIVLVIVLATAAGALWAGIAGILKATVGAHEVITTIMLNWIAYWLGSWAFAQGGPLQSTANASVPISSDVVPSARLPVFWGDADLQGLHIGFFLAIGLLVAYWLILARTTLGFRVRAVGRNPEAARYGGISVPRSYFAAMAISGAFAGLGGAMDMLGWQYRIGVLDIQTSTIGFVGIAVALLGRNTAVGVGFAALLFGALLYGTSTRSIDPSLIQPQLAGNLTLIIQALILLFIGIDVMILALWHRRRNLGGLRIRMPRFRRSVAGRAGAARMAQADAGAARVEIAHTGLAQRLRTWAERTLSGPRGMAVAAIVVAVLAAFVALPPLTVRTPVVPIVLGLIAIGLAVPPIRAGLRRLGYIGVALGVIGAILGAAATQSGEAKLASVFVWSALFASMLRYATPLIFGAIGGMFSERSGVVNVGLEGMMLSGAFFGLWGADITNSWFMGIVIGIASGVVLALIHAIWAIHFRADQIVGGMAINFLALGLTGFLFVYIYGPEGTPQGIPKIPNVRLSFLDSVPFVGHAIGDLNLMVWMALLLVPAAYVALFRTPFGLRLRSVGEHPRAADTLGLSVYGIRYRGVLISGALAACGGVFLSVGFLSSFNENMTAGRGFIALAAMIFGNWRPKGAFIAALLFGFSSALTQRLPAYSESAAVLFETLPYALTLIAVAGVLAAPRAPAAIGVPYKK